MSADADRHRFVYERLVFNRRLLLFAHVLLGLFAAFWYLSYIDFSHFMYWRRSAGLAVILVSAPASLPYLVSGVYSWRVVTDRRLGLWVFLMVLVAGAVLVHLLVVCHEHPISRIDGRLHKNSRVPSRQPDLGKVDTAMGAPHAHMALDRRDPFRSAGLTRRILRT